MGIAVTGYAVSAAYADTQQGDTILDNIYIGEVAVGGMTADEAEQAVRDYVHMLQILFVLISRDQAAAFADHGRFFHHAGILPFHAKPF